jgi:hypothetical protein
LETSDLLNNRGEKENICIPYVRVLVVSSLSFTEKGKIGKNIRSNNQQKKIILRCILTITCISIDNRKKSKNTAHMQKLTTHYPKQGN